MEIPNKNAVNINVEMMPFKKYAQKEGFIYSEETITLDGTFRIKDSGKVIKGDVFEAHILVGQDIETIYKIYLRWFNDTRNPFEEEREFVSVKLATKPS